MDDSLPLYPKIPRMIKDLLEQSYRCIQQHKFDAAVTVIIKIPDKYKLYPQVLETKWCALHAHSFHVESFKVASFLCQEYPKIFWGWLYKAESLAYLKRFDEAVSVLKEGSKEINLPNFELKIAAYRCAQGYREEALEILRDLFKNDPEGHTLRHAKNEPLLVELRELL